MVRRHHPWPSVVTGLALAGLAAGCCPGPVAAVRPGPDEVVSRYAARLLARDLDGARALLSTPAAERARPEALLALLDQGGPALETALAEAARGGLEVVGYRVRLAGGREVWLEPGPNAYGVVLVGGDLVPGLQDTPAGALSLFATALETGDCRALMTSVPPATLARLGEAQLERGCRARLERVRGLAPAVRERAHALTAEPPAAGDRLAVALGSGGRIRLVRIEGRWFVEDVSELAEPTGSAGTEGGSTP
jgi:hypothetical protein